MWGDTFQRFVLHSEKRITPAGVSMAFQGAGFLSKLPLSLQRRIAASGAKKDPYMGFVVEPWSLFLSFEISDDVLSDSKIPGLSCLHPDYELCPSSIFEDTEKRPCAILGCFNIHTSVFWGSRFELYVIARNKKTGLLSWLICDYESNTINYDPGKGFLKPTLAHSVFTSTWKGEILADVKSAQSDNAFRISARAKDCPMKKLDQRLWIEGNLSVDYSGSLGDQSSDPFGLIFDPNEMREAYCIPPEDVRIEELTFGMLSDSATPFEACCFPWAQHFITTTFPMGHEMKNEGDLLQKLQEIAATEK